MILHRTADPPLALKDELERLIQAAFDTLSDEDFENEEITGVEPVRKYIDDHASPALVEYLRDTDDGYAEAKRVGELIG